MHTTDPEQPTFAAELSEFPAAAATDPADQPTVESPSTSATPDADPAPLVQSSSVPSYLPSSPRRWPAPLPRAASRGPSPRVVLVAVGLLVVIALVGLGAITLHSAFSTPPVATPVVSRPTATVHTTATAVPTMPNFSVPAGRIGFGYGGNTHSSQTCFGTSALPALMYSLDNGGTVAVDWWVQVTQTLPDGKTLWVGTAPPYGTLPVGQSGQLQLQPDPSLCGELIGHHGAVQFSATVFYGGTGGVTVTDTITPPPPGTATPTPTLPPTP